MASSFSVIDIYSEDNDIPIYVPTVRSKRALYTAIVSLLVVVAVIIAVELVGVFYALNLFSVVDNKEPPYTGQISIFKIMGHLEQLNTIAMENSNSRSIDLGYNASVAYVVSQLELYPEYFTAIQQQHFPVNLTENLETPQLNQTAPTVTAFTYGIDFQSLRNSGGNGTVTGKIIQIGEGCSVDEYPPEYAAGDIVLSTLTSTCRSSQRVQIATQMGVGAFLLYNTAAGLPSSSTGSTPLSFPVFSVSYEVATTFVHQITLGEDVYLSLRSVTSIKVSITTNILVDTPSGDPTQTIVTGSHLDSVPAGPGINDNGSGSATNLEMALDFARNKVQPVNRVRFAWWAAEELGLQGSTYYVNNLAQTNLTELENIALNVNYDMLGSPNFFRGIYNGTQADAAIKTQSETIMNLYIDFFISNNITWSLTDFTGRSDYGPFLEYDIPAGGLFSGAEVQKSIDEVVKFGGIAGMSYDTCYHRACDTIDNIDREALDEMARAASHVVYYLAMTSNLQTFLNSGGSTL